MVTCAMKQKAATDQVRSLRFAGPVPSGSFIAASTEQRAPRGRNSDQKRSTRNSRSPALRMVRLRLCSDTSSTQLRKVKSRVRWPISRQKAQNAAMAKRRSCTPQSPLAMCRDTFQGVAPVATLPRRSTRGSTPASE